jgi:beta-glucanase (GH16 family)
VGKLEPGKSYTLMVKARIIQSGAAELSLVFREPVNNGTFRTFKAALKSTTYTDVRIDFTVPVYSNVVDLNLQANGVPFIVDSASLKMRDPIVQTEPIASTEGSTVPPGYVLAFNDEFNGIDLNRNKWFTRYIYSNATLDRLNDEQQRYRDNDNHRVANGVLSLVAHKRTMNEQWGINYESGMIRSDWTAHYGYYEARVKMPGGKGVWAAFWLNSDVSAKGTMAWPPEIDIFEYVVNDGTEHRNMIHNNVHIQGRPPSPLYYADPAWNEQWAYWTAPYNFNERWVTVGSEWGPGYVKNYIDGKLIVNRFMNWDGETPGVLAGPAHILLNLAIGGGWAGPNGIDDAAFPQALQIDWVRAYKKVN